MTTIATQFNLNKHYSREIKSLLAFVCKRDLSWILSHSEYKLNPEEELRFNQFFKLLIEGSPLAYITGEKSFYNYDFKVSPKVLIPRPETELIVDRALEYSKKDQSENTFLDIGTGSGAIIVSVAAELKKTDTSVFNNSLFFAGDISIDALKQAQINAQRYELANKITFLSGNLLEPFAKLIVKNKIKSLFIAANLPYLNTEEREREKSIKLEPDLALLGGQDGLELYLKLLQQLSDYQSKLNFHLMMEINPGQAEKLMMASAQYLPKTEIKKTPDLNGQTRFIEVINMK